MRLATSLCAIFKFTVVVVATAETVSFRAASDSPPCFGDDCHRYDGDTLRPIAIHRHQMTYFLGRKPNPEPTENPTVKPTQRSILSKVPTSTPSEGDFRPVSVSTPAPSSTPSIVNIKPTFLPSSVPSIGQIEPTIVLTSNPTSVPTFRAPTYERTSTPSLFTYTQPPSSSPSFRPDTVVTLFYNVSQVNKPLHHAHI